MNKEPKYGDVDATANGPVRKLQKLMKKAGFNPGEIDGKFYDDTLKAVNAFRARDGLEPLEKPEPKPVTPQPAPVVKPAPVLNPVEVDGRVVTRPEIVVISNPVPKKEDPKKAAALNLPGLPESVKTSKTKDPTQDGPTLKYLGDEDRRLLFGQFRFSPYPATHNDGQIITVFDDVRTGRNWKDENLQTVVIPQFKKLLLEGKPHTSGRVTLHKLIVPQTLALFQKIEDDGLLDLLLTYEGAYNPRYMRGSTTSLSNHAYGTAIDLNAAYNGLGREPARVGEKGSLRVLVPYFEAFGFYWGGYFSRKDGMHIEAAKVLGVIPNNVRG